MRADHRKRKSRTNATRKYLGCLLPFRIGPKLRGRSDNVPTAMKRVVVKPMIEVPVAG